MVLAILIMGIGVVAAQDIEPVRIGISVPATFPAATVEYAFPVGPASLGIEVGIMPLVVIYGGEMTIRYYPLNADGRGLLFSTTYSAYYKEFDNWENLYQGLSLCAGYRFILFKHLSLHASLGYMVKYFEGEPNPWGNGLGFDIGIGVAF